MKVLVVGGGGREHAIVRALRRSPKRPDVLCSPGNPGIGRDARLLHVGVGDIHGMAHAAEREGADLVVVGPEAPLVAGLVDELARRGIATFGPTREVARLEGSKVFAKEIMEAAGVATATWLAADSVEEGMGGIERYPVVLKFDGLAAGKGVVIAGDEREAREALEAFLVERRFGEGRVVVEEAIEGEELSLLALCDGETAVPLAPAQDYKRIYDGDRGPNTGGMGSYSPVPGIDRAVVEEIVRTVHQPVIDELRHRGTPFHGCLYAGLMLTPIGPRVIEFNVRFGDPETQAVLPRLRSDLVDLLQRSTVPGGLAGDDPEWDPRWAVTVVLASAGYPQTSSSGDVISGLGDVPPDVEVTHAGTATGWGDEIVTAGGRVLNVTGLGDGPAAARDAAYAAADLITFEGRQMRRDIALRAVERKA
jgi:phosphoribosylamine---glycine ligase